MSKSLFQKVLYSAVALLILLATGCSSMSGDSDEFDGDLAFESGAQGALSDDLTAQRRSRFAEGNIPLAEGEGVFRDIFFPYNSSGISDQARMDIEYNVQVLRQNPDLKIQIEGHCDERGTAEYNLALGERRAQAVAEILASLGISSDRSSTISYGEELPLDSGSTAQAWAKNRRVHFSAYRDLPAR